jgi:hypothetical protein
VNEGDLAKSADREGWIKDLLSSAFPDMKCLRCGFDRFIVTSNVVAATRTLYPEWEPNASWRRIETERQSTEKPFRISVICDRCGFHESHYVPTLERAAKPIPTVE